MLRLAAHFSRAHCGSERLTEPTWAALPVKAAVMGRSKRHLPVSFSREDGTASGWTWRLVEGTWSKSWGSFRDGPQGGGLGRRHGFHITSSWGVGRGRWRRGCRDCPARGERRSTNPRSEYPTGTVSRGLFRQLFEELGSDPAVVPAGCVVLQKPRSFFRLRRSKRPPVA